MKYSLLLCRVIQIWIFMFLLTLVCLSCVLIMHGLFMQLSFMWFVCLYFVYVYYWVMYVFCGYYAFIHYLLMMCSFRCYVFFSFSIYYRSLISLTGRHWFDPTLKINCALKMGEGRRGIIGSLLQNQLVSPARRTVSSWMRWRVGALLWCWRHTGLRNSWPVFKVTWAL